MPDPKQHSGWWLLGRSLLPSVASIIACFIGSISIVGGGAILNSLNRGTILPGAFDGELSLLYTNYIVQPLKVVSASSPWNIGLTMLIWGIVGLLVYSLVEFLLKTYQDVNSSSHDIQYVDEHTVVHHPLESSTIKTIIWRLVLGALGVRALFAGQPIIKRTSTGIDQLVSGGMTLGSGIVTTCGLLLLWIAIGHCLIVFFRLYTLRTRLLGDYIT